MTLFFNINLWSHFSCVWFFVTTWTVAHKAPLSVGFSRQEYWSGLLFPFPRDIPNPGIEPAPLKFPALTGGFFTPTVIWAALLLLPHVTYSCDLFNLCYCMSSPLYGITTYVILVLPPLVGTLPIMPFCPSFLGHIVQCLSYNRYSVNSCWKMTAFKCK